jgi:hypothetical protein
MPRADFVHLRVHFAYSLSEGAIPVKGLVKLCQDQQMPAVAVTDSGNLFGRIGISKAILAAVVRKNIIYDDSTLWVPNPYAVSAVGFQASGICPHRQV